MTLTPKQKRIVDLIREAVRTNGFAPTMQELADTLGVNKVTVFEHVEALVRKGALTRQPHQSRSLRPTDMVDPVALEAAARAIVTAAHSGKHVTVPNHLIDQLASVLGAPTVLSAAPRPSPTGTMSHQGEAP